MEQSQVTVLTRPLAIHTFWVSSGAKDCLFSILPGVLESRTAGQFESGFEGYGAHIRSATTLLEEQGCGRLGHRTYSVAFSRGFGVKSVLD